MPANPVGPRAGPETRTAPATCTRATHHRIVITVDGQPCAGRRDDARLVHLLSALDASTGIVLDRVAHDHRA
jgi:hypothetical protein